jgi:phosphoglycolate phosphatase-like HAD superfamily hydrolase
MAGHNPPKYVQGADGSRHRPATGLQNRARHRSERLAGAATVEQELAAEYDAFRSVLRAARKRDASKYVRAVPGIEEAARRVADCLREETARLELAGRIEGRRS